MGDLVAVLIQVHVQAAAVQTLDHPHRHLLSPLLATEFFCPVPEEFSPGNLAVLVEVELCEAGLATQEVGNEIVVKFNNTELMGMSTGLVCKNTKLPVPASNVTRAKVAGGASTQCDTQGEVWKCSVPRAAVASCGALVFDPRMTPPNAPTLTAPVPLGSGSAGLVSSPSAWILTVVANILAWHIVCSSLS